MSFFGLFSGPPPKPGVSMSNAYVESDLEKVIDAHPECADVIREAMRLLDPPDDFKVLLAENIAKAWPRRRTLSGTQRTQAQTIRVMRQPCFQPEIQTFKEQVLPALEHAKNSDMDPRDRSDIYSINAAQTAMPIVEGIDVLYAVEPRWTDTFENEATLQYVSIYGGALKSIENVAFFAYSTPRQPNNELALPLKAAGVEVHLIGDCRAARNILAATAEGDAVGRLL
jgi:hypothetical protein